VNEHSQDQLAVFLSPLLDAEPLADYVLNFERQHTAMKEHAEWVADHEAAPTR
jgi:hypothetical protein